jgi:uncharacterized coiled-coil protein SlyX
MKSSKPLFPLLSGYIFNLLVFRIWYYTTDTPIMETFVIILIITVLYLLLYLFILIVRSLQRPWKSFLAISIITLLTLVLIQTDYLKKYRLKRTKEKKLSEIIQLTKENRMRELEVNIVDAHKTITWLKEMLMFSQNENDKLKKQLNEIIGKTKSQEEQKTKSDVVIQKISNKDFSNINSEADNIDLDTKNQEIIFKVQIISSSTRLAKNSQQFKGLKNIWEYKENDLYKYTIGRQKDLKSAIALQSEFRRKGFTGACVIAFKNRKRIPVREAIKLLN